MAASAAEKMYTHAGNSLLVFACEILDYIKRFWIPVEKTLLQQRFIALKMCRIREQQRKRITSKTRLISKYTK